MITGAEAGAYACDENVVFVLDSLNFGIVNGPCVLGSSPRKEFADEIQKRSELLYMPTWSWDEIVCMHQLIYRPLMSLDVVAARFFVLGGVPRLLLKTGTTLAA